jgi:hypothetical protein
METKEKLMEEAALILEQEGWLIERCAHETGGSRLRRFSERYKDWQSKVKSFREQDLNVWPEPPDKP